MNIATETYDDASRSWPETGRHILAQCDDHTIVVYQAYRPDIAQWAVEHQEFGGPWSFERMSWIKPNFLWMMYRSGWATKKDQERVLAVWLSRDGFERMLREAVETSFKRDSYESHDDWKAALNASEVRLQWDPDHDPTGAAVERRAMQLGLKGEMLRRYATQWVVAVEDLTPFVDNQRGRATPARFHELRVPLERIVPVDEELATRIRLSGVNRRQHGDTLR